MLDATISKLGISAIHIAHLAGEDRAAIEGTIKLIDACCVAILYIDGMQAVDPLLGCLRHYGFKVESFYFCSEVFLSPLLVGKLGGGLQDDGLIGFALEGKPGAKAIYTTVLYFIVSL